jgi:phosphohistidine phosphatase
MKLILLRHAEAENRDPYRFPDDAARPLTKVGAKVQKRTAGALERIGVSPDRIVTSPLVRARQTADITAAELGLVDRLEESAALGADYSVANVLDMLRRFAPEETILCVGHEPDLSELAGALLGPGEGPHIAFKKSAVLGIGFEGEPGPGEGTLLFFYRPKDLLALT